jgi:hypothetical protein
MRFAICLDNNGYEASLELRKIYQVSSPESNDPEGYIRIIDESGEDYRYNKKAFEVIELPPTSRTETDRYIQLTSIVLKAAIR